MSRRQVLWPLLPLVTLLGGCAERLAETPERLSQISQRWVDLTHEFSSETVYWPTAEPFKLDVVSEGMTENGYYYSAYQFCAAEHGGTHMDAPVHFAAKAATVDQVPLERLIGPAVVVDVSAKALADRDYRVTVADFTGWEARNGPIPDESMVLLRTGVGRYWPDRRQYLGTDRRGPEAVADLHFPGLHQDAAKWLVTERHIRAVGLDTASIDYGQSTHFESHQVLAAAGVPIMENLANLEQLPARGAFVVALPMKIKAGSGAPLRAVARLPQ